MSPSKNKPETIAERKARWARQAELRRQKKRAAGDHLIPRPRKEVPPVPKPNKPEYPNGRDPDRILFPS